MLIFTERYNSELRFGKEKMIMSAERYNSELRFGKEKMIMSAVIVSFDLS